MVNILCTLLMDYKQSVHRNNRLLTIVTMYTL